MSVEEIESVITNLSPSDLARLVEWLEEFQARAWDERLERDVRAGRLDALIEEAESEFDAGRCQPL